MLADLGDRGLGLQGCIFSAVYLEVDLCLRSVEMRAVGMVVWWSEVKSGVVVRLSGDVVTKPGPGLAVGWCFALKEIAATTYAEGEVTDEYDPSA